MDRETLQAIVNSAGCTLRGGPGEFDCPDGEAKLKLLDAAATYDARYDPRIRRIAVQIARSAPSTSDVDVARALHEAVKYRIRYLGEGIDTFSSAWQTWTARVGDCDDSARLLLALARSLGLESRLGVLRRNGQPAHVVALLPDGRGGFAWAECTLDAAFGEHPVAAYRRLRARGRQTKLTAHVKGIDLDGFDGVVGDWFSDQADNIGISAAALVCFTGLGIMLLATMLDSDPGPRRRRRRR